MRLPLPPVVIGTVVVVVARGSARSVYARPAFVQFVVVVVVPVAADAWSPDASVADVTARFVWLSFDIECTSRKKKKKTSATEYAALVD
jgi:hypothetical protein